MAFFNTIANADTTPFGPPQGDTTYKNGLRRQQAAQLYGPTSVAAHFDPNAYGSVFSRKYPGAFGPQNQAGNSPFAGLSGQALQDAQIARQSQTNNQVLGLRRQNLALAVNPDTQLQYQTLQQQYQQRLLQGKAGSFGQVFGNQPGTDDEEDEEKDPNDDSF